MQGFDNIIVGAGPAGSALAHRLSADPDRRVLLLEAGQVPKGVDHEMPVKFLGLWFSPEKTWMLRSAPEAHLGGRSFPIPAGKLLGGGTSLNGMVFNRGLPTDYEAFAQMGLPSWGYRALMPYFRRLESNWRGAGVYHGDSGPVTVTQLPQRSPIVGDAFSAAAAIGLPLTDDFMGANPVGVGVPDFNIAQGRRCGAYEAYLRPVLDRRNLTVLTGAQVTKIRIRDGRAVGVDYRHEGEAREAFADGEIILACGAYRTPHLLMHSGIGAADELRELGIDAVYDAAEVGQNLSEQPAIGLELGCAPELAFDTQMRSDRYERNTQQWEADGTGPFAQMPTVVTGMVASGDEGPDMRMMLSGAADSRRWEAGGTDRRGDVLVANAGVAYPESRGAVRLASADPDAAPHIQYNLLHRQSDLNTLKRAYGLLLEYVNQPELRQHFTRILQPSETPQTDAELEDFLRRSCSTTQHPMSTCRMGVDDGAVVDEELRVRGIDGLRIADASVLPRQIGGNPTSVLMMMGEKAADLVLGNAAPEHDHRVSGAIAAAREANRLPYTARSASDQDLLRSSGDSVAGWEPKTGW